LRDAKKKKIKNLFVDEPHDIKVDVVTVVSMICND